MSSGDYTPGLVGIHHSETDLRAAGSLGLTMVLSGNGRDDTKDEMNAGNVYGMGVSQPNPTMKNAALQGVFTSNKTKNLNVLVVKCRKKKSM